MARAGGHGRLRRSAHRRVRRAARPEHDGLSVEPDPWPAPAMINTHQELVLRLSGAIKPGGRRIAIAPARGDADGPGRPMPTWPPRRPPAPDPAGYAVTRDPRDGARVRFGIRRARPRGHRARGGRAPDVIEAVRPNRRLAVHDTAREVVHDVARAVHGRKDVDDGLYVRAVDVLGEASLLVLVGLLGYYALTSPAIDVFEVSPPGGSSKLRSDWASCRSSTHDRTSPQDGRHRDRCGTHWPVSGR